MSTSKNFLTRKPSGGRQRLLANEEKLGNGKLISLEKHVFHEERLENTELLQSMHAGEHSATQNHPYNR